MLDSTFERAARERIEEFLNPEQYRYKRKKAKPAARTEGLTVQLAVRKKRLAMDELFEFRTQSISRLEAKIEAERAARDAGYPIIGYVVDYITPKESIPSP